MNLLRYLFLPLILGTVACTPAQEEQPFSTWYSLEVGSETVEVQLALAAHEQKQGLMFRESLAADQGMLFVFPEPKQLRFWMRNTTIPLDIGYFDSSGVLREIYPLYPRDETPVISRSENLQIALEVQQGWFAKHRIRPGQQLNLDQLKAMIRARGFDPAALLREE